MVTPSTTEAPVSEPVGINNTHRRFRIPGDQVRRSVADLPEEEKGNILWFHRWLCANDLGKHELGRVLRKPGSTDYYSQDSIVQLLTGGRIRRGENIGPMLDAIAALRRVEEPREMQVTSGFIETRMYREIERRILAARQRNRIQFVFGDSQIGKSASFEEFRRRHNHGQTILIETPASVTYSKFLRAIAAQLQIPSSINLIEIETRIMAAFDANMILIVDEAHRLLESRLANSGMQIFSYLRELYNKCKTCIVLSFTNEGRDKFLHGHHAKALEQLWRRRVAPLQLPAWPPDDDAALFAEAYGLPPAVDEIVGVEMTAIDESGREKRIRHEDNPLRLQRDVLKTEGLGVWIGILQDACDMAQAAKRKVSWAAVIKAHAKAQADCEIYQ